MPDTKGLMDAANWLTIFGCLVIGIVALVLGVVVPKYIWLRDRDRGDKAEQLSAQFAATTISQQHTLDRVSKELEKSNERYEDICEQLASLKSTSSDRVSALENTIRDLIRELPSRTAPLGGRK